MVYFNILKNWLIWTLIFRKVVSIRQLSLSNNRRWKDLVQYRSDPIIDNIQNYENNRNTDDENSCNGLSQCDLNEQRHLKINPANPIFPQNFFVDEVEEFPSKRKHSRLHGSNTEDSSSYGGVEIKLPGGYIRPYFQSSQPPPCTCGVQYKLFDLGPLYYPRYLPSVNCTGDLCWGSLYRCKEKHYKLHVLKRKDDATTAAVGNGDLFNDAPPPVVNQHGPQVPEVLRKDWTFASFTVTVACECTP